MKRYECLLISMLLAFCTACSEVDKTEVDTPEISEPQLPTTLKDIHPAFYDVKIIEKNGQQILVANVHALTPAANTLARQEFEITGFFNHLRNYFPDNQPDTAQFTYYGLLEEQNSAVFTIEFDMNKLDHMPDLTVPGIHVFNYSTSLTKHHNERAQALMLTYCNEAITLDSRVCQIYANE